MTVSLADVALTETADQTYLNWVGMDGIDLPIRINEVNYPITTKASAKVNLPAARVKGIHMSRLYLLLNTFAAKQQVSPASLLLLLRDMVVSHQDCYTSDARVTFEFDLLCPQQALISKGLAGWRALPVTLSATLTGERFEVYATVTATYSSTCPCSAALSRQALSEHFLRNFSGDEASVGAVSDWLIEHGSVATPHSQRSSAKVTVALDPAAPAFELTDLVDRIEGALMTPVQTAVKRADEQAFAKLNGENPMYVEDAGRRLSNALKNHYSRFNVYIRHMESLHPHDAVVELSYSASEPDNHQ